MKATRILCALMLTAGAGWSATLIAAEGLADIGRVSGLYVRESDHFFVEKALARGRGVSASWVEVELADDRGRLQRKMFRIDRALGPVAVDDRVAVKNADVMLERRGGLLVAVDEVTGLLSRKGDVASAFGRR